MERLNGRSGDARSVATTGKRQTKNLGRIDEPLVRRQIRAAFRTVMPGVAADKRKELAALIVSACASQSSLTDAWEANPGKFSRRTHARELARVDAKQLERVLNAKLWHLAEQHLPERFCISIDLTDIPYHGEDAESSPYAIQGQPKDGTTWKHRYVTVYVTYRGHRYTLVALLCPRSESPSRSFERAIKRLGVLGIQSRIDCVLADKGFYSVDVIRCLKRRDLGFIIPAQNKARAIKEWCKQPKNAWRSFVMGNKWTNPEPVRLALVHVKNRGKKKPETFAYVTHKQQGSPQTVHLTYLKRGGIEASYRLNNASRARTSSRNIATRILYFTLSMLLQNAWVQHNETAQTVKFRTFLRTLVAAFYTPIRAEEPG